MLFRVGKDNKRWKRDELSKWKREQHIFASAFHAEKFERMFGPDTKRPRWVKNYVLAVSNLKCAFKFEGIFLMTRGRDTIEHHGGATVQL